MPRKKHGEAVSQELNSIRLCSNIRSRKHPDVRCIYPATQGEFCSRHVKNPTRFQEKNTLESETTTRPFSQIQTLKICQIQRWWRRSIGLRRFGHQGPATCVPTGAENQTDLQTLDPTASIPMMYRWSYADEKKHLWLFDIRSLSMTRAQDTQEVLLNPQTRNPVGAAAEAHFQKRCQWLRDRKYCLVHISDEHLTEEQIWHQRILDVTMKYDALGYHMCLNWFEELSIRQLSLFYAELQDLWFQRLQLSPQIKNLVVPGYAEANQKLFKWLPQELRTRTEKKGFQKIILEIMDRFVISAELKEHKTLGALQTMTAFAIISPRVRQHYPWLVEMPDEQ